MHAWELQKCLFIALLKIDILLHRDVESFRVANYSSMLSLLMHMCVCGGGGGSASAVLPFHPEVKAAVSAQLPGSFFGDLHSASGPAADRILHCFDY